MLIWKGEEFRTKGIIVENIPKISKGKKNIDVYTVAGRNGFLSVDNGTYQSVLIEAECHFEESVNKDEIMDFLDGYGTLSLDGERQSTAIIQNQITLDKVDRFHKFIVQFLTNPIFEDIEAATYVVPSGTLNFLEIENTIAKMYPIMTITCTGDVAVTINNSTFYLNDTDGTYILDCKNKVITCNGNNVSSSMLGDFPVLINGANAISYTGTVTSFEIDYKKTYLVG